MIHFALNAGETLIAEQQASHTTKILFMPQANPGKLHITNQRVVFTPTQGRVTSAFEFNLNDIESFSVGMASAITIFAKNGEKHQITFPRCRSSSTGEGRCPEYPGRLSERQSQRQTTYCRSDRSSFHPKFLLPGWICRRWFSLA